MEHKIQDEAAILRTKRRCSDHDFKVARIPTKLGGISQKNISNRLFSWSLHFIDIQIKAIFF